MKYVLAAGERGSYMVSGPIYGPIRIFAGLLLGIGGVSLYWYAGWGKFKFMDPWSEYYDFARVASVFAALLPAVYIWYALKKECVLLVVSAQERQVLITWRGLRSSTWVETLKAEEVEYFDTREDGGRIRRWHLDLRRKGGDRRKLDVGKFYKPEDAERERDEANRILQIAKS